MTHPPKPDSLACESRPVDRQRTWNPFRGVASRRVMVVVSAALACWIATAAFAPAAPIESEGISPAIDESDTTEKYPEVHEAFEKLRERDADGALERLKAASEKYPELSSAHVMLARLYFQANQGPAAVAALELAVRETPDDPDPYVNFGEYALASRRFTDAGLSFAKAQELVDSFEGNEERIKGMQTRIQSGLAALAEARQEWQVAKQHLEAALEFKPGDPTLQMRLGQSMFWSANSGEGKYADAFEVLKTAVADNENMPDAGVAMGRLYDQADDRETAKQWMSYAVKAAKEKPHELPTLMGIAQWYWQINDPAAAEPIARAALELDDEALQTKVLCGVISHALGKTDEAEEFFWTAQRQSPSNFDVRNQLALVLADSNEPAKQRQAVELAESNARDNSRNVQAAATYGWALYRSGRANDGVRQLQAALQGGRISPQTAYFLGRVAADQNNNDTAADWLKKALDANLPFVHRSDAQSRHDRLAGSAVSGDAGPPTIPPPSETAPNP